MYLLIRLFWVVRDDGMQTVLSLCFPLPGRVISDFSLHCFDFSKQVGFNDLSGSL